MSYKVVICGQKWIGAAVLDAAINAGLDVIGVRCPVDADRPDRLLLAATERGIPVTASGKRLPASDVPAGTDLVACAGSFEFVTAEARARATYGAVGYHPSLLPDLKGRRAVEAAISGGYFETGGSIYVMDDGYDTGRVLAQRRVDVPTGSTASSLWRDILAPLGADLYSEFFAELVAFGPLWDAGYIRAHFAPQVIEDF